MGDRRFADREGKRWDVVVRSKREWVFEPVEDNPGPRRSCAPPGYEQLDPFELSVEELQQMLAGSRGQGPPRKKSPFTD
jgi:hypothetical protein